MATKDERVPDLSKIYTKEVDLPGVLDRADVSVMLIRQAAENPVVSIDDIVDSVEWGTAESDASTEDGGVVSARADGTLTLNRPDVDDPGSMLIGRGHTVRILVFYAGAWRSIDPDFRALIPEHDAGSGSASVSLVGSGGEIFRTNKDWIVRKSKAYPHGRYPGEITAAWARGLGIPLGQLSRGKYRVTKFEGPNSSFGSAVADLYGNEYGRTGTSYVVGMRGGKLYVTPYQRNASAFILGDQLTAFSYSRTGSAQPTTQIEGRARIGKGKAARTVTMVVTAKEAAKRFGLTRQKIPYPRVSDRAELRERIHRSLVSRLRTRVTASLSCPLLPFVTQGDAIQLDYPEEGFSGSDGFLFVESARHRVSGSDASTDLTLTSADYFEVYQKERERTLREHARKQRKQQG